MAISFDQLNASCLTAFGEDAQYQRAEFSDSFAIKIIPKDDEGTVIRTRGAIEAFVQDSDFGVKPPVAGDSLTLGGVTYKVTDVRKAGAGASYLEIREKA